MRVIKFIIFLLFGLILINAGLDKFLNYMPAPKPSPYQQKAFTSLSSITGLMYIVAVVEVLGGMLIIPPKTRAIGAIMIFPIMIGILLYNLNDPLGLIITGVLSLLNLWAILDNIYKYKKLIG
ncbi:DoxX family membrane protein [Elizabethkingia argentiflava]|uniref:DoxX family membrane protein n=1 Tax=Elizabethkingia argenteiflava TaxID=2681556 RepID=A0A845PWJ1_9FLAO|nr:DoxX family membrane protein [Elizabethkingia argenteiflava]NAW52214.1 DoxX family membrane protein [Elizabethkingia argenteiflava]